MKKFVLASLFCLAFAAILRAQEPQQPSNLGVWHAVQKAQLMEAWQVRHPMPRVMVLPSTTALKFEINDRSRASAVCSVPLLEVPTHAVDPGMPHKSGPVGHGDTIPESHLPAPACVK